MVHGTKWHILIILCSRDNVYSKTLKYSKYSFFCGKLVKIGHIYIVEFYAAVKSREGALYTDIEVSPRYMVNR